MKKRVLISLATAALLSVGAIGAISNNGVSAPQTVQAAKKGYKIQLKHNAYVFNKRGKRKGRKTLKKGQTLKAYRKIKIKGKKFYQLTKGRYVKAANANKAVKYISVTKSLKPFKVTLTSSARIYDGKGNKTPFTANKGSIRTVIGTKVINGAKYYQIGNDNYILANLTSLGVSSDGQGNNINTNPEPPEKPTQAEIDHILANNNDKLGYTIYFSDSEIAQIKDYLWQDIQNYRVENGLPAYKKHPELTNLMNKVTHSAWDMFDYEDELAGATASSLASYLPNLSKNNMNAAQSWINDEYYGHYAVGYPQPKAFNFKNRDPKNVANQLFTSFKDDSFYNKMILGHNDKQAFAELGLCYKWSGNYSKLGVAFMEVSGTSAKWSEYYNAN